MRIIVLSKHSPVEFYSNNGLISAGVRFVTCQTPCIASMVLGMQQHTISFSMSKMVIGEDGGGYSNVTTMVGFGEDWRMSGGYICVTLMLIEYVLSRQNLITIRRCGKKQCYVVCSRGSSL